MAKRPPPQEEPPDESWMATFADAITLLMAFFVMLLTFAEYDMPAFDEAAAAIAERVGGEPQMSPTQVLMDQIEDVVYEMQADEVVEVAKDRDGIVINLNGTAFFKPGSAQLRKAALPVLREMGKMLVEPKYRCWNIEVEGHTDDMPIKSKFFPSNWELSAGRAARVARFFISEELDPFRFKAAGFADTQPKVPNRDEEGMPIKENQATNRRIQMRLQRMSLEQQERCEENYSIQAMLDRAGEEKEDSETGKIIPTSNEDTKQND